MANVHYTIFRFWLWQTSADFKYNLCRFNSRHKGLLLHKVGNDLLGLLLHKVGNDLLGLLLHKVGNDLLGLLFLKGSEWSFRFTFS